MLVMILFYAFATILVVAGVGVITSRNPVYSALSLVLCFLTSAVLWMLIEAEFLAIVLVLVYVGAVMVLFLFVVMMLDIKVEELKSGFSRYAWFGWLITGLVIVEIVGVVVQRRLGIDVTRGAAPLPANYSNATELGTALFTRYAYAIELAAVLLLVAIIAAISLTLRHRKGLKLQDINAQVAVRAEDRVRLVKMKAEPRASEAKP
jgi:NADH-quinone oxidoreductase subunit J